MNGALFIGGLVAVAFLCCVPVLAKDRRARRKAEIEAAMKRHPSGRDL
jgi:hypothetical protein